MATIYKGQGVAVESEPVYRVYRYAPDGQRHLVGSSEDAEIATAWAKSLEEGGEMPSDLLTQTEAAKLTGISLKAVNSAVRDGRLTGYPNYAATNPRKGRTLVSRAEVMEVWHVS